MRAVTLVVFLLVGCAGCEEDLVHACKPGEVRWPMKVTDQEFGGALLPGVRGCLLDQPDTCMEFDADAAWEPCVPANADVAFTFEMSGFASSVYAIHTTSQPADRGRWTNIVMKRDSIAVTTWNMFGVSYPPTTQALAWIQTFENDPDAAFFPGGVGDVSASFSPPAAQGPYFTDATGTYDPNRTTTLATRSSIYVAFTPNDDQTITLAHPTLPTCAHLDGGWSAGPPNTLRLPVKAGFRTYMATTCF